MPHSHNFLYVLSAIATFFQEGGSHMGIGRIEIGVHQERLVSPDLDCVHTIWALRFFEVRWVR